MLSTKQTNIISSILSAILLLFIVQNCSNPVEPNTNCTIIDTIEVCKDTTFIPLLSKGLIPLKVGNYWEYELQAYIYGADSTLPLILTSFTVKEITRKHYFLLGCDLYETIEYDHGFGGEDKWLYWQDSTGYYSMGGISHSDSIISKSLILKHTVTEGESWDQPDIFFNNSTQEFEFGDTITHTCVSKNREFDTPIGKFSCYVFYYRTDIAPDVAGYYDIYDYVAPNIGYVGQEVFITVEEPDDTIKSIQKKAFLIGYKLN